MSILVSHKYPAIYGALLVTFAFHSRSASIVLPKRHATSLSSTVSYILHFKLWKYRNLTRRNSGDVLLNYRGIKNLSRTEENRETQIRLWGREIMRKVGIGHITRSFPKKRSGNWGWWDWSYVRWDISYPWEFHAFNRLHRISSCFIGGKVVYYWIIFWQTLCFIRMEYIIKLRELCSPFRVNLALLFFF